MSSYGRVLLAGYIHPEGVSLLEQAPGVELDTTSEDHEQVVAGLASADVAIIRLTKLVGADFDKASNLKAVVRHGVGCDNVPVEDLTKRGIAVLTVGSANAVSVAEQALALLIAVAKQAVALDSAVRSGDWQARSRLTIRELSGRRLLLLGFGRTGRELASRAQALGMTIAVYDPFVDEDTVKSASAEYESDLASALGRADAVSLHMPGGKQVLGAAELALLPPGAIIVNCARGNLIDEQALAQALSKEKLAGAGLDVLADEPPAADNPLLGLDNVVFSPHVAGISSESLKRMGIACARNALDALAGKFDPACVFNPGWEKASR